MKTDKYKVGDIVITRTGYKYIVTSDMVNDRFPNYILTLNQFGIQRDLNTDDILYVVENTGLLERIFDLLKEKQ